MKQKELRETKAKLFELWQVGKLRLKECPYKNDKCTYKDYWGGKELQYLPENFVFSLP